MDKNKIEELIYYIPENSDAAEPAELEPEEIAPERVKGLEELLKCGIEKVEVARLLTAWGYDSGFEALKELFDKDEVEGHIFHRLHGYEETYKYILDNLISYLVNKRSAGNGEKAELEIHPYVKKIIKHSATAMYDLSPLSFFLIIAHNREEYVRMIEENLESLTPELENFYWRTVRSDLRLIEPYDPEFVKEYISKYGIEKRKTDYGEDYFLQDER